MQGFNVNKLKIVISNAKGHVMIMITVSAQRESGAICVISVYALARIIKHAVSVNLVYLTALAIVIKHSAMVYA